MSETRTERIAAIAAWSCFIASRVGTRRPQDMDVHSGLLSVSRRPRVGATQAAPFRRLARVPHICWRLTGARGQREQEPAVLPPE